MTILTDDVSWDPATIVADLLEFTTVDEHTRLNVKQMFWRCFEITEIHFTGFRTSRDMFSSVYVSHECIWSS